MFKKQFIFVVVLILFLSNSVFPLDMTFDTQEVTASLNQVFSLTVKISNLGTYISGTSVSIVFDASLLQVTDSLGNVVSELTKLRYDWVLRNSVDNTNGIIKYDVGFADATGLTPLATPVEVVKIYFKCLNTTPTSISFQQNECSISLRDGGTVVPSNVLLTCVNFSAKIDSPQNGSVVSGQTNIQATLSDANNVSSISLYLNDSLVYTKDSGSFSSFSYTWDTTIYSNGIWTIKIIVFNLEGSQVGSLSSRVTVDNSPASVQFSFPSVHNYPNPATSISSFFATFSKAPRKIVIEIYNLSGELVKSIIDDGPQSSYNNQTNYFEYTYTWNEVGLLSNGVYIYRIIATYGQSVIKKTGKLVIIK